MMLSRKKQDVAWTTEHEISFIKSIGKYSELGDTMGPLNLLIGYRAALEKRDRWSCMNASLVKLVADQRICELKDIEIEKEIARI